MDSPYSYISRADTASPWDSSLIGLQNPPASLFTPSSQALAPEFYFRINLQQHISHLPVSYMNHQHFMRPFLKRALSWAFAERKRLQVLGAIDCIKTRE